MKPGAKQQKTKQKPTSTPGSPKECYRCGETNHQPLDCRFKNTICNYCKTLGHIEVACLKKSKSTRKSDKRSVRVITDSTKCASLNTVKPVSPVPQLQQDLRMQGHTITMEVDTGASGNFL